MGFKRSWRHFSARGVEILHAPGKVLLHLERLRGKDDLHVAVVVVRERGRRDLGADGITRREAEAEVFAIRSPRPKIDDDAVGLQFVATYGPCVEDFSRRGAVDIGAGGKTNLREQHAEGSRSETASNYCAIDVVTDLGVVSLAAGAKVAAKVFARCSISA